MRTKQEVLQEHVEEWLDCKRDKKKRGDIIRYISSIIKIHPKSVGRSFRRIQMASVYTSDRRGRSIYYGADVQAALYDIWDTMGRICAENLHAHIRPSIMNLKQYGHWSHDDVVTAKLCAMSLGTLKNRVGQLATKYEPLRGKSSTRSSPLKNIIPIFKGPWNGFPPGYGQLDTVAHCGGSLSGDYMFSVNYTDAATYWVVLHAQWNKGETATCESLEYVRTTLPVLLQGLHPDTGTEFINWTLKKWADQNSINLTRSEPGKKNDNMYVEERNGHVVRKFLGYGRYDIREVVPLVNEYYGTLMIYLNFFMPVRRTTSKTRVGSKYVRTYEQKGMTPYERMIHHTKVPLEVKNQLREQYQKLNLFALKQNLDRLKTVITKLLSSPR